MNKSKKERNPAIKDVIRFGQIAVDMGFLTTEQLQEALSEQYSNDSYARLRPRKLIGEIFFEKRMMTLSQIDIVLEEILKNQQ
jgi:hypothetical protein